MKCDCKWQGHGTRLFNKKVDGPTRWRLAHKISVNMPKPQGFQCHLVPPAAFPPRARNFSKEPPGMTDFWRRRLCCLCSSCATYAMVWDGQCVWRKYYHLVILWFFSCTPPKASHLYGPGTGLGALLAVLVVTLIALTFTIKSHHFQVFLLLYK